MFRITKYEFPNKDDLIIAHFSDIHYSINFKLNKLLEIEKRLKELKPDYICITGDIVDNIAVTTKSCIKHLLSFLEKLTKIAPTIICLGNHDIRDYRGQKDNQWYERINSNIIVLNNSYYEDEKVYIYGINLENNYYHNEKSNTYMLKNKISEIRIKDDKYNILLFHSPISFNQEEIKEINKFDLVLTGHTHNGLTPDFLPGNFGIIAPGRGLF